MNTLELLKLDGAAIIEKLRRSEPITAAERKTLSIYQQFFGKKAVNAGKRNGSNGVQKVK